MKCGMNIFINLLVIYCLVSATDTRAADSSRCDDIIHQVGGPCLFGEGRSAAGLLAKQHRDVAGFLVGRDSFKVAEKVFGRATVWSSGIAFEAEYKVCYISKNNRTKVAVVISSDADIPGGIADTVRLIQGDVGFSGHCTDSAVPPDKLRTTSGIRVGMTLTAFQSIMGEPSAAKGDLLFYGFCHTKELNPGERQYLQCLDAGKSIGARCSGITARFLDGILQWLEIGTAADYEC
jgi:hypothetical protein